MDIIYNLERGAGHDSHKLRLQVLAMQPCVEEIDPLLAE